MTEINRLMYPRSNENIIIIQVTNKYHKHKNQK